jgi:GT2 family glycosyltransferase
MTTPAVDVLMPVFNAAATVRKAVDSIRAQTLTNLRIIVVDDGSTDGSSAILSALAREDDRVRVVTTPNNGIVEARNEALRHATAEYIASLDADDLALPLRLECQLAYLTQHPDCVALGTSVEHIDENGAPLFGLGQPVSPLDADASKAPAGEPYIVQSTLMARRAVIEEIGGYRHVPNSEDSDLFWRLAERGTLVILPERLVRYRVHTSSTSSSIANGRLMAIGSQLGALSALRRRAGRTDLEFPRTLFDAMKAAVTMNAMYAAAARIVDAEEAQHLAISSATKLMELARYRPYEPDAADCAFIRAALPFAARLTPQNRKEVDWYLTVTAARLVRKGMLREAWTLAPPRTYPIVATRVLLPGRSRGG